MEPIIKTYSVKVVREAGPDPITGHVLGDAEEIFEVDATSRQSAYITSLFRSTLDFRGQRRHTFIDGEEHFDERY